MAWETLAYLKKLHSQCPLKKREDTNIVIMSEAHADISALHSLVAGPYIGWLISGQSDFHFWKEMMSQNEARVKCICLHCLYTLFQAALYVKAL